ncbi:NAD-dependent epimerase/dehydratase family protein [Photobacterium leiognathi]
MGKFTVFGGSGFIGSEFVKEIRGQGHDVFVPTREDSRIYEEDLWCNNL